VGETGLESNSNWTASPYDNYWSAGLGFEADVVPQRLHLNLQYQVASALEVEAKLDVLTDVAKNVRLGPGYPKNAVQAKQDGGNNYDSLRGQMSLHEKGAFCLTFYLDPSLEASFVKRADTAERANCNFRLSGFTIYSLAPLAMHSSICRGALEVLNTTLGMS